MCPCGDGLSRFVTVGTDTFLGCDLCFGVCHTRPEVTHHTRSSHGACEHVATLPGPCGLPCRPPSRRHVRGDGCGHDDTDELVQVIRVNGGKLHEADKLGAPACTWKPIKSTTIDDAPLSDVDCTRCLATLHMAA